MRTKVDYGIDLGTTNSAIARIEHGEVIIKKTDLQKDTLPSCVGYNKRQVIFAGDSALKAMESEKAYAMEKWIYNPNYFIEFKRTMGTKAVYYSKNMDSKFDSEVLSSEVLKELKSFVSDENVNAAIITVPAMFTSNQIEATTRAAKLAGISQVELLQEPIAASLAYGLSQASSDGYWLVFDFGGGTFDAALLHVEDGIIQVKDTAGDNRLGGKNLDEAIVDKLIVPHLQKEYVISEILKDSQRNKILLESLKIFAEDVKIQLSSKDTGIIESQLGQIKGTDDNGEEFDLYREVDQIEIKSVLSPIFQKAIDISIDLLKRNNIESDNLSSLLLIGGPTYSPILRSMLTEQICKPDTSIDPMTAVARGAAIYASTIDLEESNIIRDELKVQLELTYETTSVEEEELVTVKIDKEYNESNFSFDNLYIELEHIDGSWSSGRSKIGVKGDIVTASLKIGKPNVFNVLITKEDGSKVESEPSSITIMQGTKVGAAVLPYHIGIEVYDKISEDLLFYPTKGLEKSKPLPATGVNNGLKTSVPIRHGVKDDKIVISIYQGEHATQGTRAVYNHHVSNLVITGLDVQNTIPQGTEVDITIKVDKSQKLDISVYFPTINETIELTVPELKTSTISEDFIEEKLEEAKQEIYRLESSSDSDVKKRSDDVQRKIDAIEKRWQGDKSSFDRKQETFENLKKEFRVIDELKEKTSWELVESKLRSEFSRLEKAHGQLGGEETQPILDEIKNQVNAVIVDKNVRVSKSLVKDIEQFHFDLTRIYQYINWVNFFNRDIDSIEWRGDHSKVKHLLNEATNIVKSNPTIENLQPVLQQIIQNHYPKKSLPGGSTGLEK